MSTFTTTGYTIDRYASIVAALEADLKSAFGDNIKLTADSVFGQIVQIFAEAVDNINESIEGIVSARFMLLGCFGYDG